MGTGNRANQSRRSDCQESQTAKVARSGVKTPGHLCALGSAMLTDIANAAIDHKEVNSYSRGANVMLGAARVGAMVGFQRDLVTGMNDDESESLLRREQELTAELEAIRDRRNS